MESLMRNLPGYVKSSRTDEMMDFQAECKNRNACRVAKVEIKWDFGGILIRSWIGKFGILPYPGPNPGQFMFLANLSSLRSDSATFSRTHLIFCIIPYMPASPARITQHARVRFLRISSKLSPTVLKSYRSASENDLISDSNQAGWFSEVKISETRGVFSKSSISAFSQFSIISGCKSIFGSYMIRKHYARR